MSAITATTRKAALDHLATGATYSETAARFGVSRSILSRWWRQEGLPKRRPGPAPTKPHRIEGDDIALAGRWVRDGLIWRHEGAA